MATIDHRCANCGSASLRVRTSDKIGLLAIKVSLFCNRCGTENRVISQITKVLTPTYHERPEALRINKPLLQIDNKTLDMFEDEQQS